MAQPLALVDLSGYVVALTKRRREQVVHAIQLTCATKGLATIQEVINNTQPHVPVDRGAYRRGFKARDDANGCKIVNTVRYAPAIEWGRAPGTMPPILALAEWVERKGLVPRARAGKKSGWTSWDRRQGALQIAWLIARKIKARGTEARRIIARSLARVTSDVMQAAHAAAGGR
jgi:hypothetical protein